jgi:hypothetical protein
LHYAALNNHVEVATLLLSKGAKLEAVDNVSDVVGSHEELLLDRLFQLGVRLGIEATCVKMEIFVYSRESRHCIMPATGATRRWWPCWRMPRGELFRNSSMYPNPMRLSTA